MVFTLSSSTAPTTSISNLLDDDMPPEPRGSYRGSNEFILVDISEGCFDHVQNGITSIKDKWTHFHKKKWLQKRLPIFQWLPRYTFDAALGDLVAGVTVGLTVIPQALAYSGIAGLDPAYGLYSSFMGCFVYIFLGSCKDVPMGPTAIASLLTLQATDGIWQRAVLLGFLTGIVELLMGIFGFGFLIDFVSGPVSCGFTSAVSIIIVTSQVKDLLGIEASGSTFTEIWHSILHSIRNAQTGDTILGLSSIVIVLLMKYLVDYKIGPKNDSLKSRKDRICNKIFWFIGTSRNAILIIGSGILAAYFIKTDQKHHFKLIGEIPAGLPKFNVPPFQILEQRNVTTDEIIQMGETFSEMVSRMGSALIVIPLILLLENIAVCKAFANGKTVDAKQELIAMGLSNIANSFALGYPITGAVSRGAVNHASGVRTQFGNVYTGVLVIVALLYLTPLFSYIPKASLAAIIIAAVVFMIEFRVVKPMWRSKKADLVPGLSTFIACLVFPIEYGILIGIALNVLFILYHAARPKIQIEYLAFTSSAEKFMMITPDRCLIFPSAEYIRQLINKQGLKSQKIPVVIDCSHVYGADFTAAKVIQNLIKDFNERNQQIIFYNLKPSICQIFDEAGTTIKVFYNHNDVQEAIKN